MCKWKRVNADHLHDFLFEVNFHWEKISGILSKEDINEIVPLSVIQSAPDFTNYITHSNER